MMAVSHASGTLFHPRGAQDDDTLIEAEILEVEILQNQSPRWWSPVTSQFISVDMRAWEKRP